MNASNSTNVPPSGAAAGAVPTTSANGNGANTTTAPAGADAASTDFVLTVTLLSAKSLRGSKGEKVSTFARVQFADFEPKDTPVVADAGDPTYQFAYTLTLTVIEGLIDTFLNQPLQVSIFEALPKDKSALLGSGEVNLAPYFLDFSAPTMTPPPPENADATPAPGHNMGGVLAVPITYVTPKLLTTTVNGTEEQLQPTVALTVTSSRPLVPEEDLAQSNILEVHPVEVAPVPDEWNWKDASEKDPMSNLYHYTLSLNLPLNSTTDRAFAVANGCLVGPDATAPHKRLTWARSARTLLTPAALKKLRERILGKTLLDVDLTRSPMAKFGNVADPLAARYRGKVQLDVGPILLPETLTVTISGAVVNAVEIDDKDPGSVAQLKQKLTAYKSLDTKLTLRVSLARPLLDKSKMIVSDRSIFEFIPRRTLPATQIYSKRVQLAQTEYRATLRALVDSLAREYVPGQDRGAFLAHVQRRGLVHGMHRSLKTAVVKLLKEQYSEYFADSSTGTGGGGDQAALLARVYVDLVDDLHRAIDEQYTTHAVTPDAGTVVDHLVAEAALCEADLDYPGAIKALTDRHVAQPDNLRAQYELATCHARAGHAETAQQLLQDLLSRHEKHVPALVALGLLASTREPAETDGIALAETCLTTVLRSRPSCPVTLALLAVHYMHHGADEKADGCLAQIARLTDTASGATEALLTPLDPLGKPTTDAFLDAAEHCLTIAATSLADRLFAHHLVVRGTATTRAALLRARMHVQCMQPEMADTVLRSAITVDLDSPQVWAALGHVAFVTAKWTVARQAYESLLAFHADCDDALVLRRLAAIYFAMACGGDEWGVDAPCVDVDRMAVARDLFVRAKAWTGVGLACMGLGKGEEAEASLCHATTTTPRDPKSWAALALLHLQHDRVFEAEQCASYALSLGLHKKEFLRSLGAAFHAHRRARPAAECTQRALEQDPADSRTRALLTDILAAASVAPTPVPGTAVSVSRLLG
ncbi:Cilia- and flagella-associated protein 70 [Allomyces javanicus]|nr:Cilia- and flagella-associated protein 70 [Allomyces javanicus]